MDKEDREWILENVETINADTNDIDELCCALEHSTIFAVEHIQNFATKLIDLDFKNKDLQQRIDKAVKLIDLDFKNKDLQQRIDKAVEYIENISKEEVGVLAKTILLNILKGNDTNENK